MINHLTTVMIVKTIKIIINGCTACFLQCRDKLDFIKNRQSVKTTPLLARHKLVRQVL
jgi:hypothetical protein